MRKTLVFSAVVVIAVGLLFFADFSRDKPDKNMETLSPSPSVSVSPSPSLGSSATPKTSPKKSPSGGANIPTPVPSHLISGPATCQLGGEIKFRSQNVYETIGAKISYQNIDDPIRQIYWKSSPDDGVLTIGPNLFEDLPLPNGEREIGVVISKPSSVKTYTLTAKVSYGLRNSSGLVVEKMASCTGSVKVALP